MRATLTTLHEEQTRQGKHNDFQFQRLINLNLMVHLWHSFNGSYQGISLYQDHRPIIYTIKSRAMVVDDFSNGEGLHSQSDSAHFCVNSNNPDVNLKSFQKAVSSAHHSRQSQTESDNWQAINPHKPFF